MELLDTRAVQDEKTLLKLARQYIDENNTKKAIKCCRKVLKVNNSNYLALVLMGRSLEGSDEALLIFKKATVIKPDHPLAWQGLAKYYEIKNNEESKAKLLRIYNKIITLHIDESYAIKTLQKHGQLSCLLKNSDSITSLIHYMNKTKNEKLLQAAGKQLFMLLESEIPCKIEDNPEAILKLKNLNINDGTSEIVLAKLILQSTDFGSAVKEIINLNIFSKSTTLKLWLCGFICKVYIKNDSFCGLTIEDHINELTKGIEEQKYATVLTAAVHYRQGEFKEAYRQCSLAISKANEIDDIEVTLMLNCTKMLKNLSLLEHLSYTLSNTNKEKLTSTDIILIVFKLLLATYVKQKRCYEAVSVLKKIPINNADINVLIELSHLFHDSAINAEVVMHMLHSTNYCDLFKVITYMKKRKFYNAFLTLRSHTEHPIKYYLLARLCYKMNFKQECMDNLNRAKDLIPHNSKVYYCIGMYYYKLDRNINACRSYLEKSYSMCDTNKEVIKMLIFIYDKLERVDLEYELLKNILTTTETNEFWVCTRLGRICYARGDTDEAITLLQAGINRNQEDITAYEWIGDAYFRLKAYDEALRAYQKVVELSFYTPVLIYALNKIGTIYSIKNRPHEAIFMFEGILNIDPDNVAALRGITENRLITARISASNRLFHTAREEAQIAVSYVTKSMANYIKDNIYWHLLGDLLVFISRLPQQHSYVKLMIRRGETMRKGNIAIYETIIQTFTNLFRLRDSFALFKCALTYLEYYNVTQDNKLWKISYNLALIGIKEKPNSWYHWELFGRICFYKQKYDFAHQSFMNAMRLRPASQKSKNVIWCNLGLVFLKLNRHHIAEHCFYVGREAFPENPTEWIEDSILTQIITEIRNADLFNPDPNQVTLQLNENDFEEWENLSRELIFPPSQPTFDSPIDTLCTIPNAYDILEWFTSHVNQRQAIGCYWLGCIDEITGLLDSALTQFITANSLVYDDENLKRAILLGRARVLIRMQKVFAAIRLYGNSNILYAKTGCELANCLSRATSYAAAYTVYNTVITHLRHQLNNDEQVNILLTMANLAYLTKDSRFATTLLDQAILLKASHVGGILPFIEVYILRKVVFQVVETFMADRQPDHINDSVWWYYRGLNYLRGPTIYAKDASRCIQRAIDLAPNTENTVGLGKMHAMVAIAEFYSSDIVTATAYAQEALTVYPGQVELWAALILCVFSHRNWPDRDTWIFRALYAVRQNLYLPESIRQWLENLEERLIRLE